MNRKLTLALGAAALTVLALAGCSSSGGSGSLYGSSGSGSSSSGAAASGSSADAGSLSTASTSLGTVVVDGTGMTAYFYDKDMKGESASVCTGACATAWPAITTSSSSPKVTGITGTVGTIAGPNGTKQVTIDGLPIYRYAGDAAKGDVTGQGSGGIWWAVNPDGSENKGMAGSGAATSGSADTSSSGGW